MLYVNCLIFLCFIILCILFYNNLNRELYTNVPSPYFFDKCYIINLPETKIGSNRWNRIKNIHPFSEKGERFNGIYGKTYNYTNELKLNIIKKKWDYGKWKTRGKQSQIINMSDSEIGVALSHYNIWNYMIKKNIQSILVVEDDATRIAPNFMEKCNYIMKKVPDNWDIILFGFWCHMGNDGTKINDDVWKVNNFCLLHCYLINIKGANKLMNELPINMPVDSWLSSKSNKINIYRHNFIRSYKQSNPSSILIRQGIIDKQNINTNNF
jgi:GR25 family glycosyltransferase involved in LPS biosynthesis